MLYYPIEGLLTQVEEPQGGICRKIFTDNKELFLKVPGSLNNHQAWPGGYFDHLSEVMNIALVLYGRLDSLRPLPFSLSDLLLVVFLHDIEKPWKYELDWKGELRLKSFMQSKHDQQEFRMKKFEEYGLRLSPEQENGIRYAEGEHGDYTNLSRTMGPLAAVAHMCDVASARLWFGYPLEKDDPWDRAKRNRY